MEDIPSGQIVTATALIRHFAVHSRHALHEPVHIMNHGHINLSLISTELFLRLSNGQQSVPDTGHLAARFDILLDMIATQVILADQQLNLIRINLAARKRMEVSEEDVRGTPVSQLLAGQDYHFALRALERVRDTGVAEEFELNLPGRRPLIFRFQITPFPGGFVLLADEISDRVTLRDQDARTAAYEDLIDGLPGLARGAFNIRGSVTHASPALAQLIGTDESRIVGVRFATLFDASNRGTIGDAMESLLTSGTPFGMAAGLVGSDAGSKAIWVHAAPLRSADGQAGGIFLIGPPPEDDRLPAV
ncbi:PAS domain-containing protein [Sphingobium sp. EM0848]|uniref:PAS domain-containing protein n=1 Tax=Sphingobium sp. EM0848 TaxID=2743473 RepID=UPI00159C63ED|nr:PAS domain-containing protein [Sphingobium sp. EM0848]